MGKRIKEIWLFSQYFQDFCGTRMIVSKAKEALCEGGVAYRHTWVTNFSVRDRDEGEGLYFRALPLPVYMNNLFAGIKWRRILQKHPAALVADGSSVAGAIAFAANIPYVMCIATSFFDEYKIRNLHDELRDKNYSLALNKLFFGLNKIIEYHVLKKARFIIVLSSYMLKSLKKEYSIDEKKIEYLPYPIMPKVLNKNKSFNDKGPRLLSIGRVDDKRKNYIFLLKVFSRLIKKYPQSRLKIIGEFSPASKVLRICRELKLNPYVDFPGSIPNDKLGSEFEQADIFVLGSRQEGLGIVYLEAMAHGVPVVTTKCGGPEGVISDNVNGYLVDQDDLDGFCEAVTKVWSSQDKYRKLVEGAYNYIAETHNPQKFNKRFIEILQDKLGGS